MKRTFLSVVLLLMFALCFTACSSGTPSDTSSLSSSKQESAVESETGTSNVSEEPKESSEPAEESNILIAYFSHSGNTEAAAEQIAALTGGTLAEIERVEEYGDLEAEAEAEILNGDRPEITVDTDNISDYDVVFVGYPIWWDEAPAMISTFLANNDCIFSPNCALTLRLQKALEQIMRLKLNRGSKVWGSFNKNWHFDTLYGK